MIIMSETQWNSFSWLLLSCTEHAVQMFDTFVIRAVVWKVFTWGLAPGNVAVAQVRVANALKGANIPEYLGLAGSIRAALLHFITSCNRNINSTPGNHAHAVLLKVIQLSLFVSPYREHQPWAGHRSPGSSQHSTGCSCRAALTRSRCQQLCTCPPWRSYGMHIVSAVGKADYRHLLGCILWRKAEEEQLLWWGLHWQSMIFASAVEYIIDYVKDSFSRTHKSILYIFVQLPNRNEHPHQCHRLKKIHSS